MWTPYKDVVALLPLPTVRAHVASSHSRAALFRRGSYGTADDGLGLWVGFRRIAFRGWSILQEACLWRLSLPAGQAGFHGHAERAQAGLHCAAAGASRVRVGPAAAIWASGADRRLSPAPTVRAGGYTAARSSPPPAAAAPRRCQAASATRPALTLGPLPVF